MNKSIKRQHNNDTTTSISAPTTQKMQIEYIKTSELGKNFHKNYLINIDKNTNQSFIIDYTQKYKYIIIDDDQNLDNNIKENFIENDRLRYKYGYVDENELKLIDLTNIKIFKDDIKNEYYIQDIKNLNRRWIILPNNWSDDDNNLAPYICEDDVDLLQWIVYLDTNSNRKYIIDERSGTNYYLVPSDYMIEFRKYWSKFYKSELLRNNNNNNEIKTNEVYPIIEYVNEDELTSVDLLNVKIQKDDVYNEYYIQNPISNINHRWIVLPKDWRTSKIDPYISDEDFNPKDHIIYFDSQKRRYIRDDTLNRYYFIVPTINDHKQTFKYKWNQIQELLRKNKNVKLDDSNSNSNNRNKIRTLSLSNDTEIQQLQQSPKISRNLDPINNNNNNNNQKTRVRSPSNDLLERGIYNKDEKQINRHKIANEHIYTYKKSNSSDNLIETRSPNTNKKVYFNENVKVSDGKYEYNDKLGENARKLRQNTEIITNIQSQQQQQQPPIVKPRIIKPMNTQVNLDPHQDTSINRNNQQQKYIYIKQSGKLGHAIKINQNASLK